jgi:hypothetical protein
MTKAEIAIINRAITTLQSLLDKPQECGLPLHPSPLTRFVQEYLTPDPGSDFGCEELWEYFREIVKTGALPPMRKTTFLRQLPAVMEAVYNLRKCHHIERFGHRVRGFRGINSKSVAEQILVGQKRR